MSKEVDESKGRWRTICGRKVFIEKGQTLTQAMRASGKFKGDEVKKAEGNIPKTKIEEKAQKDNDDQDTNSEELKEFIGKEFKGVKGKEAIKKLVQEKCGHVKGAFHREDIGDIDLVWGNDRAGLCHTIAQRSKENNGEAHVQDILDNLEDAIIKGAFSKRNDRGNFEFVYKKDAVEYRTIIAPEYHKNKITFVLTAFRRGKKKKD